MADRRESGKSQTSQPLRETKETSYIREQIVEQKQKPVHMVKYICVGLLFVLCASIGFGTSFAVVNHWMNENGKEPKESMSSHTISYNEDDNGNLAETEESSSIEERESVTEISSLSQQEWIDQYLETKEYTIEDLESMKKVLYDVYEKIQKSIVAVQVFTEEEENHSLLKKQGETFGIIVSMTNTEAILLTDGNSFSENAMFTAFSGTTLERDLQVRQRDGVTGITTLVMSLEGLSVGILENMHVVTMGNCYEEHIGEMIIMAGSPMGIFGSVQYGYISYIEKNVSVVDGEQRIFFTNCMKIANSSGAMFNLDGELIGWLDTSSENAEAANLQKAIAISDLKYILEDVVTGVNTAYAGIIGCTVTDSLAFQYEFPKGVYVTETASMSPAYYGGIQPGDIITEIDGNEVTNILDLQTIISSLEEQTEINVVLQRKGRDGYKKRTLVLTLEGR